MRKRPTGVWIITAYIAATHLSSLLGISRALLFSGPDTEWASSYYRGLPWWAVAYLIANAVVWLCAGTALFLLHTQAFAFFIAAAALGSVNLLWQALRPWTAQAPLDQGVAQPLTAIGLLVSAGILVAILVYVFRLKQRGMLQHPAA
jgi:hypothetical protein